MNFYRILPYTVASRELFTRRLDKIDYCEIFISGISASFPLNRNGNEINLRSEAMRFSTWALGCMSMR